MCAGLVISMMTGLGHTVTSCSLVGYTGYWWLLHVFVDSHGDSEVMCVRYSPDALLLAAGYADGYVKVINSFSAVSDKL